MQQRSTKRKGHLHFFSFPGSSINTDTQRQPKNTDSIHKITNKKKRKMGKRKRIHIKMNKKFHYEF